MWRIHLANGQNKCQMMDAAQPHSDGGLENVQRWERVGEDGRTRK